MKRNLNLILTTLFLVGILSTGYAQRNQGKNMNMNQDRTPGMYMTCNNIPDLTEDQQDKIQALRTKHLKAQTENRNVYREKMAQIRTLTSGNNTDMAKAEALADEASAIKSKMLKSSLNHRNDIRSLLTEDQRVYFDARSSRIGMHNKMSNKRSNMKGNRMHNRPNRPCRF
ncbi:MAG: Spy/CpxP family protein refolding chaperone [Bacteroidales bacterium]